MPPNTNPHATREYYDTAGWTIQSPEAASAEFKMIYEQVGKAFENTDQATMPVEAMRATHENIAQRAVEAASPFENTSSANPSAAAFEKQPLPLQIARLSEAAVDMRRLVMRAGRIPESHISYIQLQAAAESEGIASDISPIQQEQARKGDYTTAA